MMVIAITISAIAAWYSVEGLTAIFAAAVVPVIIMGGALEAGKITATVWLHNNWARVSWLYKTYLIPAILFLMLLTSMGIFGFLSKAHSDQNLVSGDAMSKVAIYDEQIKTEKDNIDANKRALQQMDAQVDSLLGRTDTERGAERAVLVRKQQAKERASLQTEIVTAQKKIARLQEERAPMAAEFRKIEADVGPVKYIAAFVYGDNPDANVLERAVSWIIILIVIVFDPLALCLILASNRQLEWAREDKEKISDPIIAPVGAMEPEQLPDTVLDIGHCYKCNTALLNAPGIGPFCPNKECDVADGVIPPTHAADVDQFFDELRTLSELEQIHDEQADILEANAAIALLDPVEEIMELDPITDQTRTIQLDQPRAPVVAVTQELSKDEQPMSEDTSLNAVVQSTAEPLPAVDEFNTPVRRGADYAVRYRGKVYNLDAFTKLHPSLVIQADNGTTNTVANQCGFGDAFPVNPAKGDMFIRTDYLPEKLFKWNNTKWIEVDKNSTDSYTYNQAYIQHLISKLEAGEYEIEDLNAAEQSQVEQQIEEILKNKNV